LEIQETGDVFTHHLTSDILNSFASDTITMATGINFTKGTYTFKAYFSSVLDVDRQNDTLETSIAINPDFSVQVELVSGGTTNCLAGESPVWQDVTITNTGNMDLQNIGLILQIDTGSLNQASYITIKDTCTNNILIGNNVTYRFKTSYSAPWHTTYYAGVTAYLLCDSTLANGKDEIVECVDTKDLYVVSIDNPSTTNDAVGATVNVTATLRNRADNGFFSASNITVLVENSRREQMEIFTENLPSIGTLATVSHTFNRSYTVPNDSVYYLIVYTNSQDNYPNNDTMTIRRETISVGIEALKSIDGFTLYQNIPNPAKGSTRIDYSISEAGTIVFNLHSISGQLLYSKTIEASNGKQSIELNTNTFAAGIYFYSIEYKGQRLVKRMMISGRVNE
jgi:hypothetical protein